MTTILGAAASGLVHNQAVMDVVANNLANVNTAGYKKVRALAEGAPTPGLSPQQTRLGVAATTRDLLFSAGALLPGAGPLHFAFTDDSFLVVHERDGALAYTRVGALELDGEGNVTAQGGRLLEPPATLPAGVTAPAIDAAGQITALDAAGVRQLYGQVTVARFENPQGLGQLGEGLYAPTVNSGPPTSGTPGDGSFGPLNAGVVEGSNVELAEEFAAMLVAQRAYQASARTFSVGDQMLALATNLTR
ncbi:MAG: flagellar hook basal-body protein [Dehalococcoidia bacterium]|nr:flagellar hook basal-body protein [Dehalococcoidia bacterium]